MKKAVACLFCCLLLCGCYDNVPINRCAHPLAAGYDAADGTCTVTGIYYMPTAGDEPETHTIRIEAESPGAARARQSGYSFESWSPDLLSTVVFGESAAQRGIYPFLDMLARSHMLSADVLLCACEGDAADLLTPEDPQNGARLAALISDILQTAGPGNLLPRVSAAQAYAALLNDRSILLPLVVRRADLLCTEGSLLLARGKAAMRFSAEETAVAVILSRPESAGLITFSHRGVPTTAQCAFLCSAAAAPSPQGVRLTLSLNVRAQIAEHTSELPAQLESSAVLDSLRRHLLLLAQRFLGRTHALGLDPTLLQTLGIDNPDVWRSCRAEVRITATEKEG